MSAARPIAPLTSFLAWEAVSSIGESAAETSLLLRAGLNNVAPSRFVDATGDRVMACSAPALPPDLRGTDRMVALALLALARLHERVGIGPKPLLLLAVPERHAADEMSFTLNREGQSFLDALRSGLPTSLQTIDIEVFPFGRAAGAVALRRALELVGQNRFVIWGGVDTYLDWATLDVLAQATRLLTAENVDGLRPGEGAAFLVLGPPEAHEGIRVLGIGTGRELCPVGSGEPCQSVGLTAALAAAVAPLRAAGRRSNCWLLDNSHEAYATQELQNVIARFGDVLGLRCELQMPLKELGDVGAAALPMLATLCAEAWRLGYASDDTAVITGCSERGARGAMLLGADHFHAVELVA